MFFYILRRKNKGDRDSSKRKHPRLNRTLKAVAISVLAVAVVCLAYAVIKLSYVPKAARCEGVGEYSLEADTDALREGFFEQFGYRADIVDSYTAMIPCTGYEFERYNELQKSHGLDLSPYVGRQVQVYTAKLDKKVEEGTQLYGIITVYKGMVIAAHITDFHYPSQVRGLWDK